MPTLNYDEQRPWSKDRTNRSPHAAFYQTRQWKKARYRYALERPYCEVCIEAGRYGVRARLCDHLVSIPDYGALLDEGNLCRMCYPCHHKKTAWDTHKGWPADMLEKSDSEPHAWRPKDKTKAIQLICEAI